MRPRNLARGDVVRIIAPSSPFDRGKLEAGIAILEAEGFVPRFDDGLFAKQGFLAGDDARRLGELEAALADDEARALWMARGGYGATRLLPRLDAAPIARAAKWLVGFSDTTALHAAWERAGVASLHGANVTTLAEWGEAARAELFGFLRGEATPLVLRGRRLVGGGNVRGRVVGGNLTVLAAMAGTGALPSTEGAIVFLEDVGERPYRLDRALTQLLQTGYFAGAVAIVVGQLTGCTEPNGGSVGAPLDVVAERLEELGVPLVGEVPCGHEPSSHPMPFGVEATLDVDAATLLWTAA